MGVNNFWMNWREVWLFSIKDHSKWLYIKPLQHFSMTFPPPRMTITTSSSSCIWQLSCRGSYHFLEVWLSLMQCPSTSTHWHSFRRPRKDDRLSQPLGVLIQRPMGLELRTRGSQATTQLDLSNILCRIQSIQALKSVGTSTHPWWTPVIMVNKSVMVSSHLTALSVPE